MSVDALFQDPGAPRPVDDRWRWPAAVVRRERIEAETERLVSIERASDDVRRSLIVHPSAGAQGRGFAPGIRVSIDALAPGETSSAPLRNSTSIGFVIRGSARVMTGTTERTVSRWDAFTVAPGTHERITVDGSEPFAMLRYSNAALLELLGVLHETDEALPGAQRRASTHAHAPGTIVNDDRVQSFGPDGPYRLEYERVVDPPYVEPRSWHWPWEAVKEELDGLQYLDGRYGGRRVCLLYDPATGRTNGTTFGLFASMAVRPAGIVDLAHRHVAAAINYFFSGCGWSTLDGERIDWDSGDLVFVAPGWTSHHHASGDGPVYQIAVQDNPLHLGLGSLLWQESFDHEPKLLGLEPGFTTNRLQLSAERSAERSER